MHTLQADKGEQLMQLQIYRVSGTAISVTCHAGMHKSEIHMQLLHRHVKHMSYQILY